MAGKNLSFKKKQHFLNLINGIPREKILFCPIDVSKHFHIALFHDIDCKPLSDFFEFSASKTGFDHFVARLQETISLLSPQLVFIGMEPTNVFYEGLLHNLHQRFSYSTLPKFQLCILDPIAVKENRKQHSLHFQKSDFIDTASIGDLLTRGLFSPAHFSSAACIQIKELSRSINDYRRQLLKLWNRTFTTIDRVFPNLLIDYGDEKPLCKKPIDSTLLNDLLHLCPDPYTIVEVSVEDLRSLFHQQGRRLGAAGAEKISRAANRALLLPKPYQQIHLETLSHQIETLDFLKKQIGWLKQQLCGLIAVSPARHLAQIKGNSELLTADFIAGLEDWDRYEFVQQVWNAAGLNPSLKQSGSSSCQPHICGDGSFLLRNAIYKMTACVVWHEPTFGIPCFERLIDGKDFVATILHVGRKLTNTALAILKSDTAFRPPFENYQQAQAKLRQLQQEYKNKKRELKA